MNFQAIIDPALSILSESASQILSVSPVSMSPYAQQLLVEVTYIDNGKVDKSYCIYDTDSQVYTTNISDYIGGDVEVDITSVDVAWSASAGVTFAIAYVDKTESSYLSTTTGNRIAIVENGALLYIDIIKTISAEVANVGINNLYINSLGTKVVFSSAANNLVGYLDTNDAPDVFLLDIPNSTIERVSQITNDDEGSEPSNALGFSEVNGVTKVLMETAAPEFSTIDLNDLNDLYLVTPGSIENTIDLVTETSANNAGSVVNGQAIIVSDTIVYVSNSDELVSGDSNQSNDIFIHNITTNTRSRLTSNLDSTLDAYGLVEYELLGLSEDVSKLMFSSNYETLDTAPDLYQVYLMNTSDNSIEILSQTIDGISGNDASLLGVMDSIGSNYAYQTNATNLLADIPGILITDVEGVSEVTGTTNDDILQGTAGIDNITTLEGADVVYALAGNDTINLSADSVWSSGYAALNVSNDASVGTHQKIDLAGLNRFSDVIDGGADIDTLNLTDGNDAFFIEDIYSDIHPSFEDYFATALVVEGTPSSVARIVNLEVINAGEGNDIVDLTSSHYILANAIEINGEAGNDILWGSNGNDSINGGDGNDTINGGTGFDDLSGGTGADIFQFTATSGSDDILDFDITQDSIQLYYRAGDDHTNADLDLTNGILTWDVLIDDVDNVVIDLSATVTSSDLNDLDALISFVEIV